MLNTSESFSIMQEAEGVSLMKSDLFPVMSSYLRGGRLDGIGEGGGEKRAREREVMRHNSSGCKSRKWGRILPLCTVLLRNQVHTVMSTF